jgi:hypothetical protein
MPFFAVSIKGTRQINVILYAKAMSGRAALKLGKNGEHVGQGPTFGRIGPFVQLLDNADAQW